MNQPKNNAAQVTAISRPTRHSNSASATAPSHANETEPQAGISEQFIYAMRNAVTGVNVVTTNGMAGQFGLTVSAMCSVSAEPAMLLICINRKNPICDALLVNRVFCVNVLSTRQHEIAKVFSGNAGAANAYDFSAAQWESSPASVARMIGAIATFDCTLEESYAAGTHLIFIGRVTAASTHPGTPLLYTNRRYGFPLKWG